MKQLKFSYNWNNKLNCNAFTSLRLANPGYYKEGQQYEIICKKEFRGYAVLQRIKVLKLADISDFIAFLDTGYSMDQTRDILKKMYKTANWETQEIYFMLFVKSHPQRPEPTNENHINEDTI